MVDRAFVRDTLVRLVQIDSVNPRLVAGAPGEANIAAYVAAQLMGIGIEPQLFEPERGRVSVVGLLRGTGGGRRLMLNAHLDTVGVAGMQEPFSGAEREGRIYGRGAYDMKGSLAGCLGAVNALKEMSLRGDVLVAAVADEEYGSLGTRDLLEHLPRVDGAIVTEPTALNICLAHKGYLWIEVMVRGRAAHGSKFEQGIDANMKMGKFLAALETLERALRERVPHPLVGPPSLHAAVLEGGSGLSTYAASSRVQIERRTVPGESEEQAVAEIQLLIDKLSSEDRDFHATVRPCFRRDPFEIEAETQIVKCLGRAAEKVRGLPAVFIGDTPWMDAALLQKAGVETAVFGPTGGGAHADAEWVTLDSVFQLADILTESAFDYCR